MHFDGKTSASLLCVGNWSTMNCLSFQGYGVINCNLEANNLTYADYDIFAGVPNVEI